MEKIIRRLKIKGYIKTGYAHKIKGGKNHTARVIVPMCFSEKCKLSDFKLNTVRQDGQDTVLQCAQIPSYSTKSAVLQDDLLERNRKENRESTSLPLPAEGQAKTLTENAQSPAPVPIVRNFSQILKGTLRKAPTLTEKEFEQRRQDQIRRLKAS